MYLDSYKKEKGEEKSLLLSIKSKTNCCTNKLSKYSFRQGHKIIMNLVIFYLC